MATKVTRKVGDMHPNGKWVWTEYAKGKFDWRAIKKTSEVVETEESIIQEIEERIKNASMDAKMYFVGDLCQKLNNNYGYSQKASDRLVKKIDKKYESLFQESFNKKYKN